MESITQFIDSLKALELNIFITNTNLEPLIINQHVPNSIKSIADNPDFINLINKISSDISSLNKYLEPISSEAKKATKSKKTNKTEPYADFQIDEPPLVKSGNTKQLSFLDILSSSPVPIEPIKRRKPFSYKGHCVHCDAPEQYLYQNTKSQILCKVCNNTFSLQHTYHEEIVHHCPHCEYKLDLHHNRKDYDVLVCPNKKCSFYLKNQKLVSNGDGEHLKTSSQNYKLKYHFRLFNFNITEITNDLPFSINSKINLDKIHHSKYTLGLILTYFVNYGLSSRKTSKIMYEVHGVKISHQTVVNYSEAVAAITETLNEKYQYELSDTITFDETYIKVKGKNNYVFFGSDPDKKIITSYRIFNHRTTRNAVTCLYQTFNKFSTLPEELKVITDGNPIYNAAQIFFKMNDISFDLHQVIGVKNDDEVSKEWRPYKQVEERLNRTYKQNYHGTNGYGSLRNANVYMSLYVTFFNFLRAHSSLNYRTPIIVDEIYEEQLMPNKWLKLLSITKNLITV